MSTLRWSVATALFLSIPALTGCQRSGDRTAAPSGSVSQNGEGGNSPAPSPVAATPEPVPVTPPGSVPIDPVLAPSESEAEHRFEIRDQEGKPIVTDRQIVAYEWKTHRIKLQPGTKVEPPPREGDSLVSGVPFTVAADGTACYSGVFTVSASSNSQAVPVIDIWPLKMEEDTVRIQLGYPTEEFFRGADPRSDRRIRTALSELGKLKE